MIYMAVCTDAARCGAAIYSDSILQLVADRKDYGDPYKGLDIIIQRVDPEIVIVSCVQKRLIAFLEKRFKFEVIDLSRRDSKYHRNQKTLAISGSSILPNECNLTQHSTSQLNDDQLSEVMDVQQESINESETIDVQNCFKLAIVPNSWFSKSKGVNKLEDSIWVKGKGIQGSVEKSLFVNSRVKTSIDICAIRAIAALDTYISHSLSVATETLVEATTLTTNTQASVSCSRSVNVESQLSSISTGFTTTSQRDAALSQPAKVTQGLMPILDVRYTDPGPVLSIDRATLETLGVFHNRCTESNLNTNPSSDCEIHPIPSLYEVLNQCQSPQGKRQMHTLLLWPLQDIIELQHRHDTVEYFIQPESKLILDQLVVQLKNIVPLAGLLTKFSQSVATYKELSTMYKALWSSIAIIDLIKANKDHHIEIFQRIIRLDNPEFRATVDSIMSVVDFEASRKEDKIQLCFGVHESVDAKKEIIKNLMKFCDEVAVQETSKYKDILGKTCRVLYIPRIGFLCSFDYTSSSELLQIKGSKEFDVLLHTEQSVYFKTSRMEELDNGAGDIACDLIDMQESVIVELQNSLLRHADTILNLMELCGEMDCLIAFATISFQRNYTRPEMITGEQEIVVRQAYHPLQCMSYNSVPNDIRFYNEAAERKVKIMLITGPNSCGKTTYMKAVCLTIYMAHIGCFVPATQARMPVVDAILTRMHSGNSITTGLSSFAEDLHQVNYALSRATNRSVIAIDEFGKGTQARDGFNLLKGLVVYFASRTFESPYVMIATHFNRLINHLQNYSEFILYKTFKVTRDMEKESVIYEFRMIDGVCDISLADRVAARAGVPQQIIDRAKEIKDYITEGRAIRARPPSGA